MTRLILISTYDNYFQIDPPTVKQLDSNLFLGEEIKEVYQEIMRTVPTHHLDLDDVSCHRNYSSTSL